MRLSAGLALTLLVLVCLCCCENCEIKSSNNSSYFNAKVSRTITIGFLSSYGHAKVVLGALPLAVDYVNSKPQLNGCELHFEAADVGATAGGEPHATVQATRAAVTSMTNMRDRGAVAFIGPDDTCFSEALVAAAWNLPLISYKCADTRVSDKRVFPTFARTLPPSSKVSKSVVALLRAFQWDQFVLVVGRRPAWRQLKEAVMELATHHGLKIIDTYQVADYIPKNIQDMERIVSATYKRTRVYVFLGEHIALVDLVKCLQRRRLLDTGDYVIISVDDQIYDPENRLNIVQREYLDPFLRMTESDGNHTFWGEELPLSARDIFGFRSVLKLTPSHPRNPRYDEFCEQIRNRSAQAPFNVPYHPTLFGSLKVSIMVVTRGEPRENRGFDCPVKVPIHAAHLYDAVIIYHRALMETVQKGEDPRDGTAIFKRIRNRSYHSIQGYDVFIDNNGDAEGNYTVVALLDDAQMNGSLRMSMQPVGYFQYTSGKSSGVAPKHDLPEFKYYDERRQIQWVGGAQPRAEPRCGFRGEKCEYRTDWRLTVPLGAAASALLVAAVFACRHYRYEHKLACLLWKVDMRDVTIIPTQTVEAGGRSGTIQVCRHSVFRALGSVADPSAEPAADSPKRAFTRIGLYRGSIVAIKPIHKRSIDLTRSIRKELKQMREVRHENIIPFVGACVEHGNLCILMAYCARGSLEDVLANQDLRLDPVFVSSLVSDILKGLAYLHDSEIVSHGNLRSSNCLVDSRWVLQISDFGLHEFKAGQEEPERAKAERRMLWRAPELLRDPNHPPRGTQKGDVYSFGIILYEVVGRAGPWGDTPLSNAEIVARVSMGSAEISAGSGVSPSTAAPRRVLRPPTRDLGAADYVVRCMHSCWDEDPDQRPDIRFVRVKLKEMQAGLKANIFDNMLAIMEKYAYNLEGLVQERTNQLTEEKKKTDALLYRMLPRTVAEALKRGSPVEAENFDCVTIYFSDIVGFTELSANSTPLQVVELLNELYTCCDSIISHYDVYKVETIGDAYMVASGLPVRNGDRHAGEVAAMALHMLSCIRQLRIRHRPGELLRLRIGIHSGQCVAGVVGLKMPRYCLFGDTVNTASRMESTGEAFRIHISEATWLLLQRLGGFQCEERGLTTIKGKGEMRTYWLVGEDDAAARVKAAEDHIQTDFNYDAYSGLSARDTPDLLRRTSWFLEEQEDEVWWSLEPGWGLGVGQLLGPARLEQLHSRALASGAAAHKMLSPRGSCSALLTAVCSSSAATAANETRRSHYSAPTVSFTESGPLLQPPSGHFV